MESNQDDIGEKEWAEQRVQYHLEKLKQADSAGIIEFQRLDALLLEGFEPLGQVHCVKDTSVECIREALASPIEW